MYVSVPDSQRVHRSSSLRMTESVNSTDQSGSAVVAVKEGRLMNVDFWSSLF